MTASPGRLPMSFSFKMMLLYAFINGVGIGFAMLLMVLFYGDKFGLQPIGIGMIISVSGFIGLFVSLYADRLSDRWGRKPLIALGNVVSRFSGFVLPITTSVAQATWVVGIRSIGANLSMPTLRADITPAENRGRYLSMFGTAFTSGMVAGPIMGTFLYGRYRFTTFNVGGIALPGYGIPFFLNAVLGIASTVILLIWVREPSPEQRKAVSQMPRGHPH